MKQVIVGSRHRSANQMNGHCDVGISGRQRKKDKINETKTENTYLYFR